MALLARIKKDLDQALKKKDSLAVSVLRLLLAEIHNQEIEKQKELTDEDVLEVIRREVKKRKEAVEAYQKGNRKDLAEKEGTELKILNTYLPQQLSDEELKKIVASVVDEVGAKEPTDFGQVMGAAMGRVKGQADGAKVATLVKEKLAKT